MVAGDVSHDLRAKLTNPPQGELAMMPALNNHDCGLSPESIDVQAQRSGARRRWKRWVLGMTLAMTATTGLTGCTILGGIQQKLSNTTCIDDFMISHRNKVMAARAWLQVKHCFRNHAYPKDIRAGFIAGYLEVAMGGSGCTPTVVSSQYWGWRHQSGNGQAAVNAWFEGFPLGVKAAEQDGIGHFNMIRLNAVPHVNTNMTGSAAPTPAAAPMPGEHGMPKTPRVDEETNALGGSGLSLGLLLGEGETLVPGQVTMQEVDPESGKPSRSSGSPEMIQRPEPVPGSQRAPDQPMDRATSPENDAAPKNPFTDEVSHRGGRRSGEIRISDDIVGKDHPSPRESATSNPPLELVPKTSTRVSTQPVEFPENGTAHVSEPSQTEIDSVIEEIFGKPPANGPQ